MAKANDFTYQITNSDTSVKIDVYYENVLTKTCLFPKGTLSVSANNGDNQTVNFRLSGSRNNIFSVRYDKFLGEDYSSAVEAIEDLSGIL